MITRSVLKLAAIGGLVALVLAAGWQWRADIRNAAQWAIGFDQVTEALRQTEQALEEVREHARWIDRQHTQRDRELRELQARTDAAHESLRALADRDPSVRAWLDSCVPDAIAVRYGVQPCPPNGD